MKDYKYDNSGKHFIEIKQLLETAKSIDSDIESLTQKRQFVFILMIFVSLVIPAITILLETFADETKTSRPLAIIISAFIISLNALFTNIFISTTKKIKKEKRALSQVIEVIQDVTPFYYKEMSVLEKANIEAQLARLDITGFQNKK